MVSESVAKCTRPLNAADEERAAAAAGAGHYFHFYLAVFILDPLARSRQEKLEGNDSSCTSSHSCLSLFAICSFEQQHQPIYMISISSSGYHLPDRKQK